MTMRMLSPLGVLLLLLLPGCSEKSTAPERPSLSITPADGATGVRLDASVVLDFGGSMDRATVEQSFHLLPEGLMNDSLCSPDSATLGDMTAMMGDPGMMEHMLDAHSAHGQFQWDGSVRCAFTPDAPMVPGARYMIYLGPEMAEMMGSDSMMGHRDGMSSEMTLHFTTLDSASHEGHHRAAALKE